MIHRLKRLLPLVAVLLVLAAGCDSLLGADFDRPGAQSSDASIGHDGAAGDAGTCSPGAKLCGGQCVQVDDPRYGCGQSTCSPCSVPYATAVCTAGQCAVATCQAGRADCDMNPGNGCEVDLTSDPAHCGTCRNACGSSLVCNVGSCSAACNTGLTDCGGACVDTTSNASHCGGCTTLCEAPSGGVATCAGSQCGAGCNAFYEYCGGACVAEGPSACGSSCAVCPTPTNGIATCTNDQCGVACNDGLSICGNQCCANEAGSSSCVLGTSTVDNCTLL